MAQELAGLVDGDDAVQVAVGVELRDERAALQVTGDHRHLAAGCDASDALQPHVELVGPEVAAGADRDGDAVIAACRERMAGYRVPKRVEWVDELPRNAYGKVLKRALRERFSTPG